MFGFGPPQFWASLVGDSDQRRLLAALASSNDQQLIDARFDLSDRRLRRVFRRCDTNGDGSVNAEELLQALRLMGYNVDAAAGAELRRLLRDAGSEGDEVSLDEFGRVLASLKLAELLRPLRIAGAGTVSHEVVVTVAGGERVALAAPSQYRNRVRVTAFRAPERTTIHKAWGESVAEVGDWLARELDGSLTPYTPAEFARTHEPLPGLQNQFRNVTVYHAWRVLLGDFSLEDEEGNAMAGRMGDYVVMDSGSGSGRRRVIASADFSRQFEVMSAASVFTLRCADWSSEGDAEVQHAITDFEHFFFASRAHDVRWVHLDGLDRLTILRLAVRYRLNPLSVEDTLLLQDQPPKIDKLGEAEWFVSLRIQWLAREPAGAGAGAGAADGDDAGSVDEDDDDSVGEGGGGGEQEEPGTGPRPRRVRVNWLDMGVFLQMPSTIITVVDAMNAHVHEHTDDADSDQPGPGPGPGSGPGGASETTLRRGRMLTRMRSAVGGGDDLPTGWSALVQQLENEHSALREFGADFVLYALLDLAVDRLFPIVRAYRHRLRWFQRRVHKGHNRHTKELPDTKAELQKLARTLRPMHQILRRLMNDESLGVETRNYLQDVRDHLDQITDDIAEHVDACNSLKEEYEQQIDRQSNDTLYVLTVVTTLFMPSQLVASIFGMNFVSPDTGDPAPSLLTWEHGFLAFWLISLAGTGLLYLFFRRVTRGG